MRTVEEDSGSPVSERYVPDLKGGGLCCNVATLPARWYEHLRALPSMVFIEQ